MASGILFQFDTSHHAAVVVLILGAALVFAHQTGAGVKVVVARCQNVSSKLFWLLGQIFAQIATPKAAAQRLQSCCRCISSSVMNRLGHRKLFSTHDAA